MSIFLGNIDSENIESLRLKKNKLIESVDKLILLKKQLYSNVDIESPMSSDEKELNSKISKIFSEIQPLVKKINKLKYPK
jgi:hypothetical protein